MVPERKHLRRTLRCADWPSIRRKEREAVTVAEDEADSEERARIRRQLLDQVEQRRLEETDAFVKRALSRKGESTARVYSIAQHAQDAQTLTYERAECATR